MTPLKKHLTPLLLTLLLTLLGSPASAAAASPAMQPGPDSVDLEYFIGTANYPQHILLEWQSVNEISVVAYRLKRGVTPDPSQAVVITNPVIPAHPGSPLGYYYAYPDSAGLVPGTVYYYWIEDQDTSSLWNTHQDDPNLNPIVPWGCSIYDVICDFVIDTQDVTALASRWNCALSQSCYDPHFDVNSDNVIDVRDVMLSAGRWGCALGQPCYP
jgi:hypothetical protein